MSTLDALWELRCSGRRPVAPVVVSLGCRTDCDRFHAVVRPDDPLAELNWRALYKLDVLIVVDTVGPRTAQVARQVRDVECGRVDLHEASSDRWWHVEDGGKLRANMLTYDQWLASLKLRPEDDPRP